MIFFTRLLVLVVGLCGCIKPGPTPTPGPIPVVTDAGPPDIFHGITADCTLPIVASQKAGATDSIRTCLDVANTAVCFVQLANTVAKDTVVCVVQQMSMSLHQSMAKGTANDTMKTEAAAADNWITTEHVGIRN